VSIVPRSGPFLAFREMRGERVMMTSRKNGSEQWRSGGGGTEDSSFLDDWVDESDGSKEGQATICSGRTGLSDVGRTKRTRKRTGRGEFDVTTTD